MVTHRITKYNPQKRNAEGAYLDHAEWTAISDVGRPGYTPVTYEEYEKTETAYVNAVKIILAEQGVASLKIDSLELHATRRDFDKYRAGTRLRNLDIDFNRDIKSLRNGLTLNTAQIDKIIRLILRETVWMLLVGEGVEVRFGYDYYMHISCLPLRPAIIQQIKSDGLFVEPGIAQRKFKFINGEEAMD